MPVVGGREHNGSGQMVVMQLRVRERTQQETQPFSPVDALRWKAPPPPPQKKNTRVHAKILPIHNQRGERIGCQETCQERHAKRHAKREAEISSPDLKGCRGHDSQVKELQQTRCQRDSNFSPCRYTQMEAPPPPPPQKKRLTRTSSGGWPPSPRDFFRGALNFLVCLSRTICSEHAKKKNRECRFFSSHVSHLR